MPAKLCQQLPSTHCPKHHPPSAPPCVRMQVLGAALRHMRAGSGLAGWAFWMLAAPSYPDYDGFTVYFSGGPDGAGSGSSRTAGVIKEAAAAVAALNREAAPAAAQGGGQADHLSPLLGLGAPAGPTTPAGSSGRSQAGAGSSACSDCACM